MRICSKCSLWASAHQLGLLSLAVGLLLLAGWSQRYYLGVGDHGINSSTSDEEDSWVPVKIPSKGPGHPPILAYWILGSKGDGKRILRLLKAIYHPRNQYLLQLDAGSSEQQRRELAIAVRSERVFRAFGNVNVVGRSYGFNWMGASALASALHAAALLLKICADWDWFITLSASDYPLMTQDDLLHAFSSLPRDLNFVNITSNAGRKKRQNINQIIVDPSLYFGKNSPIFYAAETRATPDAFKIFGGSPWMILSRGFMEHCVNGWDNLPRKLMMYFSNVAFPLESYFHSVLCNSPEFQNTTVGNDLRCIIWDTSKIGECLVLNMSHYDKLVSGQAAFARPFKEGDPVLQELDDNVLNRPPQGLVAGKWSSVHWRLNSSSIDSSKDDGNFSSTWADIDSVKPGSYGLKLEVYLSKLVAENRKVTNHCSGNET